MAAGNTHPALWVVGETGTEVRLSFAELSERSSRVAQFLRCAAAVAPYKRIRRLQFSDLPKTISGKIRRTELRSHEHNRPGEAERKPLEFSTKTFPISPNLVELHSRRSFLPTRSSETSSSHRSVTNKGSGISHVKSAVPQLTHRLGPARIPAC
jgi:hypothetical protein